METAEGFESKSGLSSDLVCGKLGEKVADTCAVDDTLPVVAGEEVCSAVLASGGEELMCRGLSGIGAEAGFAEETSGTTVSCLDLFNDEHSSDAAGTISLCETSGLESLLCVSVCDVEV